MINDQRCENLRLQYEISQLVKEKNSLNHSYKNLKSAVEKMEIYLGVSPDFIDCTERSKKTEDAIFENNTKPLLLNNK